MFDLRHAATDRVAFVVVGERRLFAIDGVGEPSGADHRFAAATLRLIGAALRGLLARHRAIETRVGILECAWWTQPQPLPEDLPRAFVDRSRWHWRQLLEVPARASDEDAAAAIAEVRSQAGRSEPLVRVVRVTEGRAAQILHVGGSATEPETLERLYVAVASAGFGPRGPIHELRLADEATVPAGRARSILRVPI